MVAGTWRYARRNPNLMIGIVLLLILLLFSIIGPFFVDVSNADALSVSPEKPPSWLYPFGTDSQGRDLLAVMVAGTPLTLRIGILAGLIGLKVLERQVMIVHAQRHAAGSAGISLAVGGKGCLDGGVAHSSERRVIVLRRGVKGGGNPRTGF